MKSTSCRLAIALAAVAGSIQWAETAHAGTPVFAYTNRDMILSFRKTGATGGTTAPNNLEVDIGQASRYYGATPGSTNAINQVSAAQIAAAFDTLNDLSWSVDSLVPLGDSGDASVPARTLWVTSPRPAPSTAATPLVRNSSTSQGVTGSEMKSISDNASFYSGTITANALNNTASVVAVPVGSGFEAGAFLGSLGNYKNTFQSDVENTTPANFVGGGQTSRSDLYELRPDATGTQPAGTYLGYFELKANGTLTFVAAGGSQVQAPSISVSVANNAGTITFPTASGVTYTLYYTNSAGLTAPVATWPAISTTILGDGTSRSFQFTPSDPNRFFRVGAR